MVKKVGFRKKNNILGSDAKERREKIEELLSQENKKRFFSASRIQCYKDCPLKYKYKYVDKIKKQITAPALTLGISYHKALEYIYECVAYNRKAENEVIKSIVESTLDRSFCDYMNDQEWNDLMEEAKKLPVYYNDHKRKFKPLIVNGRVCTELDFEINVRNPITNEILNNVFLRGSMDLVTDDLKIIDFKTASRSYSDGKVDTSVQMTTYSYAFREMFQQKEENLLFDVILKKRKSNRNPEGIPETKNFYTSRDQKDYIKLYYTIKEIMKAEECNVFCPTNPGEGSWCKNCDFKEECDNWQGNE